MRAVLFLLVFVVGLAFAGELKTIVEPQVQVSKRVIFLVDVSGSMDDADRIPRALASLRQIAQQPMDEMEFAVIAFAEETKRWEGIPDGKTPKGWAALPSADAIQVAQKFITDAVVGEGTYFEPPLVEALSEERDDLTIILLSDGKTFGYSAEFTEAAVIEAVKKAQDGRESKKLKKAVIYCIELTEQPWLITLIKANGGGLYYSPQ